MAPASDAPLLTAVKGLAQEFQHLPLKECRQALAELSERTARCGKDLTPDACKGLISFVLSVAAPRCISQETGMQWGCLQLLCAAGRAARHVEEGANLAKLHTFFFALAKKEVKSQPVWKPRVLVFMLQCVLRWMQVGRLAKVLSDESFKFDVVTSFLEALYGEMGRAGTRWTPRWRLKSQRSLVRVFKCCPEALEAAVEWAKKSESLAPLFVSAVSSEIAGKGPESPQRAGLVELYTKHVLEAKQALSDRALQAWAPAVAAATADEFTKQLLPTAARMSKRQAASIAQSYPWMVIQAKVDMGPIAQEVLEPLGLECLKDKDRRAKGYSVVQEVAAKCADVKASVAIAEAWAETAKKAGKVDEKHAVLTGISAILSVLPDDCAAASEGLSRLADPKGALVKLSHEDANEDARCLGYGALGALLRRLPEAEQGAVVQELAKALTDKKATDRVRLAALSPLAEFADTFCASGGAAPAWAAGVLDKVVPLVTLAATKPVLRLQSLLGWALCGSLAATQEDALASRLKKEQLTLLKDGSSFLNSLALVAKAPAPETAAELQLFRALLSGRVAGAPSIGTASKTLLEAGKVACMPPASFADVVSTAKTALQLLASARLAGDFSEDARSGLGSSRPRAPRPAPAALLGLRSALAKLPEAEADALFVVLVQGLAAWLAELAAAPKAEGAVRSSALRGIATDIAAATEAATFKPNIEALALLAVVVHHPLVCSRKFSAPRCWNELCRAGFLRLVDRVGAGCFWKAFMGFVRAARLVPEKDVTGFRQACIKATAALGTVEVAQVEAETRSFLHDCRDFLHSAEVGKETEWNIAVFFAQEGVLYIEEGTYVAEERQDKNVKKNKFLKGLYDDDDLAFETAPAPKPAAKFTPGPRGKDSKVAGKAKAKAGAKPDGGNMTAQDIEAAKIQEQSETRARIRLFVEEATFVLDVLTMLSRAKSLSELLEEAMPDLAEHFFVLLASPLTALRAQLCLCSLVQVVIPEEILLQRQLLAEALTIAGKGWLQRTPSACGSMGDEPVADRVLGSVAAKEVMPAASFALLLPLLLRVLRDSCYELKQVCARSLTVLESQLVMGAQVPEHEIGKVFDSLSVAMLKLPPIRPATQAAMLAASKHLITSGDQLAQLADMFFAEEDVVRGAVIAAIAELQHNDNFQAGAVDAHRARAVLRLGALDSGSAELARGTLDALELGVDADLTMELIQFTKSKPGMTKDVQLLVAKALAETLDELDDAPTTQQAIDELVQRFNAEADSRVAVAYCMVHVFGGTLQNEQLVVKAFRFLLRMGLAVCGDGTAQSNLLRDILLEAGMALVGKHSEAHSDALFAAVQEFEDSAAGAAAGESARLGVAVFLGALSGTLGAGHAKSAEILPRLLQSLLDPTSTATVQDAIVKVMPPIMKQNKEATTQHLNELMNTALAMKVDPVTRRGAAMGLGACVKGLSIQAISQHSIQDRIMEAAECKKDHGVREGALLCIEGLASSLGRLFDPYAPNFTKLLLAAYSDPKPSVQVVSQAASKVMMAQLSGPGVKQVLPKVLESIQDKQWRTKLGSIELLAAMTNCMPKQLAACLPQVVPALCNVINDQHSKVKEAAREAIDRVGDIITNPELKAIAPELISALIDGGQYENITKEVLDKWLGTSFVHHVDAPSLSLVCPLVQRALKGSSAEMKRKGAQIVGSMVLLIKDPKDIQPYLPTLLPLLKERLMDPVPDVRATVAKAFGTLANGLPEEMLGDAMAWMLEMLKSTGEERKDKDPNKESSAPAQRSNQRGGGDVERNGAAHGLSEMLMAMGTDRIEQLLPDILNNARNRDSQMEVKDGYLGLFVYLPVAMGPAFEPHLQEVLTVLLQAQADESSSVRETAFKAGQVLVKHFGATHTSLLLGPLDEGIFDSEWRIRYASVALLGQLIEMILRAHRLPTQSAELMFYDQLPLDWRRHVLTSLYVIRSDDNPTVKQACAQVWKAVVQNTPRTLKELLTSLMERLIESLASSMREKQRVAARCVGDLVGKLGERVMPELMPIFMDTLSTDDAHVREGVCIGLAELINATTKELLAAYLDDLIPAIQQAIIDESENVRSSASLVVALLHQAVGSRATTEIVMWVLAQLMEPGAEVHGHLFLNGLEQLVSKQPSVVLPLVLQQLTQEPEEGWTIMQVRGLAVLSFVQDGHTIHRHLSDTLPVMCSAIVDGDDEMMEVALESATRLMDRVEQNGLHLLTEELVKALRDDNPKKRVFGARLMCAFFESTKLDVVPVMQEVLKSVLPVALDDPEPDALVAGMATLNKIVEKYSKEVLSAYLGDVRTAVLTLITDPATGQIDENKLLPGLCEHKALDPLFPLYQQCLMHGSAEQRELAAKGVGELVDHTTEAALKPHVVKITGPLLRIVGDRFPGTVKKAILETLRSLLVRGGATLRPFLPQLQSTYVKCLSDPTEAVRRRAGDSLSLLVKLAARTEPMITELTKEAGSNADPAVRVSMAQALGGVLTNVPQPVPDAVQEKILEMLAEKVLTDEDSKERAAVAWPLGVALHRHLTPERAEPLMQSLTSALSGGAGARHGAALTLASACWCQAPQLGPPEQALADSLRSAALPALPKLLKDDDPDCRIAAVVLAAALARFTAGTGDAWSKLGDSERLLVSAVGSAPAWLAVRAVRHYAAAAAAVGASVSGALGGALAARATQAGVEAADAERAVAAVLAVGAGASEASVQAALGKFTGPDAQPLRDYASKRLSRLAQRPADSDFAWDFAL